jgi:hypothetical protein
MALSTNRAADTCNHMHYDYLEYQNGLAKKEYDQLPEAVRALYTFKEWLWLGTERDRIIQRETMPDGPPE